MDCKPIGKTEQLLFNSSEYDAVFTGMHMDAEPGGTAANLQNPIVTVAAKTGTAQINGNTRVNSWVEGFFPLDHPKFAFIVLMENGPLISTGASHAMQPVITLLANNPNLLTE